jgi:hypothetical protein
MLEERDFNDPSVHLRIDSSENRRPRRPKRTGKFIIQKLMSAQFLDASCCVDPERMLNQLNDKGNRELSAEIEK